MSKKIHIFLVTLNYQLLGSQEYSNDFYLKKKKIKQKQNKPNQNTKNKQKIRDTAK